MQPNRILTDTDHTCGLPKSSVPSWKIYIQGTQKNVEKTTRPVVAKSQTISDDVKLKVCY